MFTNIQQSLGCDEKLEDQLQRFSIILKFKRRFCMDVNSENRIKLSQIVSEIL